MATHTTSVCMSLPTLCHMGVPPPSPRDLVEATPCEHMTVEAGSQDIPQPGQASPQSEDLLSLLSHEYFV